MSRRLLILAVVGLIFASCSTSPSASRSTSTNKSASQSKTSRVNSSQRGTSSTTSSTSASTSTSSSTTRTVVYNPFTSAGLIDPGLHVTQVLSGICSGAGVAGNSSYRCFGNKATSPGQNNSIILDPCFLKPGESASASSGSQMLICVTSPTISDVIELNVTNQPTSTTPTSTTPTSTTGPPEHTVWAMQVSTDQVCVKVNAAWGSLGPFSCAKLYSGNVGSNSSTSYADCHVPFQAALLWQAPCQSEETTSSPFTLTNVRIAWT